jgi:hypothetical protein
MHRSETHILGERGGLKEVDGGAAMVHVQRVEISTSRALRGAVRRISPLKGDIA